LLGWVNYEKNNLSGNSGQLPQTEEELDILNRIETAYLEYDELQVLNLNPMYMRDWIAMLDDYLNSRDGIS
jgi:hypothetical protein